MKTSFKIITTNEKNVDKAVFTIDSEYSGNLSETSSDEVGCSNPQTDKLYEKWECLLDSRNHFVKTVFDMI